MKFNKLHEEDRRLVILRFLAEDTDYRVNTSILQDAVEMYGHNVSRDVLHADIHWLSDSGLVEFEEVSSVLVVSLTDRGLDVSQGRATVLGVKRPRPGM